MRKRDLPLPPHDTLTRGEAREAAIRARKEVFRRTLLDERAVIHDKDHVKVHDRGYVNGPQHLCRRMQNRAGLPMRWATAMTVQSESSVRMTVRIFSSV